MSPRPSVQLPYAAAMTSAKSEEGTTARSGLLSGKVCVVSGVGPGLGRQAAKALAAHGADLVLAARRQSTLDEVLAEVSAAGAPRHHRADRHHRPGCLRPPDGGRGGGVRRHRRVGEQRVPLRRLPELRGRRSGAVAEDHGHQPVRVAADDPGGAARHARPWRWIGRDGRLHGDPAAPAGTGGLCHFEGRPAHGDAGARLRARAVEGAGERRRARVDGRAVGRHLRRNDLDGQGRPGAGRGGRARTHACPWAGSRATPMSPARSSTSPPTCRPP